MAKFIGFLYFLITALSGFWGAVFFAGVLVPWIAGWLILKNKEKKGTAPELDPWKTLPEQEGVTLLYKKD